MELLTSLLVSHATDKRPISIDWTAPEVLALNLRLCSSNEVLGTFWLSGMQNPWEDLPLEPLSGISLSIALVPHDARSNFSDTARRIDDHRQA
jgi:hypothetical protein